MKDAFGVEREAIAKGMGVGFRPAGAGANAIRRFAGVKAAGADAAAAAKPKKTGMGPFRIPATNAMSSAANSGAGNDVVAQARKAIAARRNNY